MRLGGRRRNEESPWSRNDDEPGDRTPSHVFASPSMRWMRALRRGGRWTVSAMCRRSQAECVMRQGQLAPSPRRFDPLLVVVGALPALHAALHPDEPLPGSSEVPERHLLLEHLEREPPRGHDAHPAAGVLPLGRVPHVGGPLSRRGRVGSVGPGLDVGRAGRVGLGHPGQDGRDRVGEGLGPVGWWWRGGEGRRRRGAE